MINLLKIVFASFFCLLFSFKISYSAQQITGEVGVKTTLRICADPNNLPYSSQDTEGYENKIANLFAKKLGNIPVIYAWYPMTSGFVRRTLKPGSPLKSEVRESMLKLIFFKDSSTSFDPLTTELFDLKNQSRLSELKSIVLSKPFRLN